MTRDEAIAKIQNTMGGFAYEKSELVNSLVALGILKLDNPKSGGELAFEIIRRHAGATYGQCILMDLDAAGLKIVEK